MFLPPAMYRTREVRPYEYEYPACEAARYPWSPSLPKMQTRADGTHKPIPSISFLRHREGGVLHQVCAITSFDPDLLGLSKDWRYSSDDHGQSLPCRPDRSPTKLWAEEGLAYAMLALDTLAPS